MLYVPLQLKESGKYFDEQLFGTQEFSKASPSATIKMT